MKMPTPDPGTHWVFERGDKMFTGPTGYIPKFNLVDSATGKTIDSVRPDAYYTKFGVRQAARRVITNHREAQRSVAKYTELEAQYPRKGTP